MEVLALANRIEVIDHREGDRNIRPLTIWEEEVDKFLIMIQEQDGGKTVKIFLSTVKENPNAPL